MILSGIILDYLGGSIMDAEVSEAIDEFNHQWERVFCAFFGEPDPDLEARS